MHLGHRITYYREKRDLKKAELARLADIPQSAVSQIESGDTLNPGIRTITSIARALNIPVCALLVDGRVTMVDELPVAANIKQALTDPAFHDPLELALLMYEHQIPTGPIYPIIYAFIKERARR